MKAITIQQPWAHLIIHGYIDPKTGEVVRKEVERGWRTKYRGITSTAIREHSSRSRARAITASGMSRRSWQR